MFGDVNIVTFYVDNIYHVGNFTCGGTLDWLPLSNDWIYWREFNNLSKILRVGFILKVHKGIQFIIYYERIHVRANNLYDNRCILHRVKKINLVLNEKFNF